MRRVDLIEATMQGWARLNPSQRERFFKAGLKAALRLDRLELRAWLLRRLRNPPLAAPIDPARFAISDADIALLLRAVSKAPGETAAGPDRDKADGLSKVQSVDQRMRLGMRCRLSPTADVPSHTSGAAMCHEPTSLQSSAILVRLLSGRKGSSGGDRV